MGEGESFQQMALGKLDIHKDKNEVHPYLTPYIKIITKWIKDLNVTTKLLKPQRKVMS